MRRIFSINIVTDRQNFDYNTGVVVLLLLNDRNNIGQHIGLNADWIKAHMRVNFLLNLFHRHIDKLGYTRNHLGRNRFGQWKQ